MRFFVIDFFGALFWLIFNFTLYLVPVFLLFRAGWCRNHGKRFQGAVLVALAAAPFVHYGFYWIANSLEPARRSAEVSSWARVQLDGSAPVDRLELYGAIHGPPVMQLVAAGLLGATMNDPDSPRARLDQTVSAHTFDHGSHCIDPLISSIQLDGVDFVSAALARRAFHDCDKFQIWSTDAGRSTATTSLPIVILKQGPGLRYAGPACREWDGGTLELRLPAKAGGGLIDFYEPPVGLPLTFPPVIGVGGSRIGGTVWGCLESNASSPDYPVRQQKLFTMVSQALGRSKLEDFPLAASQEEVVTAIRSVAQMRSSHGTRNALLTLLGQWPSTPNIAAALLDPTRQMSGYQLESAFALLLDQEREPARRAYYAHLHTHVAALLAICKNIPRVPCDDRERDIMKKLADGVFQSR